MGGEKVVWFPMFVHAHPFPDKPAGNPCAAIHVRWSVKLIILSSEVFSQVCRVSEITS